MSANLGCGGPHSPARERSALDWLQSCNDVDLLLVQEAPVAWKHSIRERFTAASHEGPNQYRCRSFVAVRRDSDLDLARLKFDGAEYHGSYVAAATVRSPTFGSLAVLSLHASPTRPSQKDRERWVGPLPPARPTGAGELWDSDFALESVARLRSTTDRLLVAGDWNEARAWDDHHPGQWGAEFFEAVRRANLIDCTQERWGCERRTHQQYQDDHVFASAEVNRIIGREMTVLPLPGSDHDAIAFTLQP